MITRIIIGFLIVGLGVLMAWKTSWFVANLGESEFAMKYFSGGGYTLFKFVGILFVILGAIVVAGLQGLLIDATIGQLFFRGNG
jgi:hypothetical protein